MGKFMDGFTLSKMKKDFQVVHLGVGE